MPEAVPMQGPDFGHFFGHDFNRKTHKGIIGALPFEMAITWHSRATYFVIDVLKIVLLEQVKALTWRKGIWMIT